MPPITATCRIALVVLLALLSGCGGGGGGSKAASNGGGGTGGGGTGGTPPQALATPSFDPPSTPFVASQSVALTSTASGATIRYTLDGSAPGPASGLVYAGPITLTATTTVRAIATKPSSSPSPVGQSTYTRLSAVGDKPASRADAARFLNQATFGARSADIDHLLAVGYSAWFTEQVGLPFQTAEAWMDAYGTDVIPRDPRQDTREASAFYSLAVKSSAQLRMRMWWALSQILVVSTTQSAPEQIKYYMSMLQRRAFARYRDLLEEVTYHCCMADMLSYLGSRDIPSGNVFPDQNYAREVMQLFSIGLYLLNPDGTRRLGSDGLPIPTYTIDDIIGLSRVWTGLYADYSDDPGAPVGFWQRGKNRIVFKNDHHSYQEKRFLGVTLPAYTAGTFPDALKYAEVKTALDTIASHPNVGPFIGRQLIQRFVTSNPSPGYVRRVAAVFADNGSGVRGDLLAVIKAILLDPEARDRSYAMATMHYGKVREEMLCALPLMRALNASSPNGQGQIFDNNPNEEFYAGNYARIGQIPFRAPGVFNWYRPGHVPPVTRLGDRGYVSPELQTLDSLSLLHWSRYLGQSLDRGGSGSLKFDDRGDNVFDFAAFLDDAQDPTALVDRIDLLLLGGTLPAADKATIAQQVATLDLQDHRVFFGQIPTPATAAVFEERHELGMAFTTTVAGTIRAIRYWRPAGETGTHYGRLWGPTGTKLAEVAFTNETASGWQRVDLPTPVPVQAGIRYTVSVNANAVHASVEDGLKAPRAVGALRTAGKAARFAVDGPLTMPSYESDENCLRDVVFRADASGAAAAANAIKTMRIKRALFLALMHPAYLVQK